MNTLRFALIRLLARLIGWLSTDQADPADLTYCYRLLLDRAPDAAGWQIHMQFIRPGQRRRTLVDAFLQSTEFQMLRGRSTVQMAELDRFVMAVDGEDPHIGAAILGAGAYEPHVTATLIRELKPDSVFVDVGANMGWFTLTAAAAAPYGRVVAIEPNYNNVQLLYRSLIANQFDNVRVLSYAVSDRPARLRLNFFRSNGYISDLDSENGTTAVVEAMPLDALLADLERIDVLKMDIEGHEPIALRGMAATLSRYRPVLLCEFHPAMIRANAGTEPEAYLRDLGRLGYRLAVIRDDGRETGALEPEGIMAEWERVNRERGAAGELHLDLIGRWEASER